MPKPSSIKESAKPPQIVIIGKGKVGQALAQLFEITQFPSILVGRSLSKQKLAARNANIVLLCVNDASIQSVCEQIAPSLSTGTIVSHCSAVLDSTVLSSAKTVGCSVASTHPLNTFPHVESALKTFADTKHNS